jgi:hypothetical protein
VQRVPQTETQGRAHISSSNGFARSRGVWCTNWYEWCASFFVHQDQEDNR